LAVGDDDDAAAGEQAGVRDGAGGGGEDLLAGGAGEVDAAMAGKPALGWEVEATDDLWSWLQGPHGVAARWGAGGDAKGGSGSGGRLGENQAGEGQAEDHEYEGKRANHDGRPAG
jgi:hypothetical protein